MSNYTEAQKRATAKYKKEKMDDVHVLIKKGARERWKAEAEKRGKSLNRFIIDTVEAEIARDDAATPEDLRDIQAAREEYARGEAVPHEAIDWD